MTKFASFSKRPAAIQSRCSSIDRLIEQAAASERPSDETGRRKLSGIFRQTLELTNMQIPLQISFRHMDRSAEIESSIRDKAADLDKFASDIMSCRIVAEPVGKHHEHGNLYQVRIDITVPGEEIVVTREPAEHAEHKDINVAIRDAFDAARRKLEDYVRCRRRNVKTHEILPHGRVSRLFPHENFGFLETPDGREVYFHGHSVVQGAFNRLQVGTEVTFVEEQGEKGPQASTVKMTGKHHHV
jgi:cold shock CspA family protein/ribosome-associated translation inhibitor RaiA